MIHFMHNYCIKDKNSFLRLKNMPECIKKLDMHLLKTLTVKNKTENNLSSTSDSCPSGWKRTLIKPMYMKGFKLDFIIVGQCLFHQHFAASQKSQFWLMFKSMLIIIPLKPSSTCFFFQQRSCNNLLLEVILDFQCFSGLEASFFNIYGRLIFPHL